MLITNMGQSQTHHRFKLQHSHSNVLNPQFTNGQIWDQIFPEITSENILGSNLLAEY